MKRILIIDDDPGIVKVLKARLEANKYDVICAYDGEEGLSIVRREKPDLIIVDILMPRMDGYTFVRQLRDAEDARDIPVIVLTGKEKMQSLFSLEGVNEYVTKPFDHNVLLDKISKCIEGSAD